MLTDFILVAGLAVLIFWVSRIFYVLQRGLNEMITGLGSLDQRLAKLEDQLSVLLAQDRERKA